MSVNSISADDPAAPPTDAGGEGGTEVVLIEDSRDYALALRAMLDHPQGASPFSVTHFTQLAGAVDYVQGNEVGCLLLDLNLPDATGIEGVRALQRVAPQVPIVVLTGLDDDQLALDAMHAGAQDYLVKGHADVDLITRSIRYAIERARSERHRSDLLRERTARAKAEAMAGTIARLESPVARPPQRAAAALVLQVDHDPADFSRALAIEGPDASRPLAVFADGEVMPAREQRDGGLAVREQFRGGLVGCHSTHFHEAQAPRAYYSRYWPKFGRAIRGHALNSARFARRSTPVLRNRP